MQQQVSTEENKQQEEEFKPQIPKDERQEVYEETDKTLSPLTGAADVVPIVKKDLFPDNKGFVLYNVLSPSECRYYMEQADQLGMSQTGYRIDYRNTDRVVAKADQVSALIWERVKGYMEEIVITEENTGMKQQVGQVFNLEGTWRPHALNEIWRLCRYPPGGHFAPHFDGYFVRNGEERSMKTFMLYLNSEFEGGTTNFVSQNQKMFKDETGIFRAQEENILFRVKPEPGMALVFNHMILHEGERVQNGQKYIMRSDVMYRRVEGTGRQLSPKEVEGVLLYQKAELLEADGKALEAAECYRKAFKLCPQLEAYLSSASASS
jgi:hypothetical protein